MDNGVTLVIGIDLGTYNSAACVLLGEEVVILRPQEGATEQGMCFPSFVEFDEQGEFVRAGELARRSMPLYPHRVIWGVKRLIGKSFKEAKSTGELERFQFEVVGADDGSCSMRVGRRTYSPAEISAFVLRKIRDDAQSGHNPIGRPITEAVITVPAYFSPFQKEQTQQAGLKAGFERVHLIPEPTSASLAYRLKVQQVNQYIMVIDLGAGTLDVAVALLYVDKQGRLQTDEKGHGGNTALGGVDMDDAIMRAVVDEHRLRVVAKDALGRARLRTEIEKAKIELSTLPNARIAFAFEKMPVDLAIGRGEIDRAVEPIIERCRGPIHVAMKEASLQPADISHVLLVGGPTMMPIFRRMVVEEFAENPNVVKEINSYERTGFPVNPMEAVARGAVLGAFGGITPHAYGILLEGTYYEMIPRRQRYPCRNNASYSIPGHRKSLVLSVIQKAMDEESFRENHVLLGSYQFDYRPEPGQTALAVEAEYTENGVLDLKLRQPSTMIELPLFGVSNLEGRKISRPPTPIPVPMPTEMPRGSTGGEGPRAPMPPPEPPKLQEWSDNDLAQAIRLSNRLVPIAQSRLDQVGQEDRQKISEIVGALGQWVDNTWENANVRAPQIRNLNRALLHAMLAHKLISQQELAQLQRGIV